MTPGASAPDGPTPDAPPAPTVPAPGDRAATVRATVDIAAPPERVFAALTDPAALAAWWAPDAPDAPGTPRALWSDARPGGRWRLDAVDGDGVERTIEGEYRVVDPPRTLEHSWHPGDARAPGTVRYELVPRDVDGVPGTRVTVTHTGIHAVAAVAVVGGAVRWPAGVAPAWVVRRPYPARATRVRAFRP